MTQVIQRPSPNQSPRKAGSLISVVVMHATASHDTEQDIAWLCNPVSQASAHVVIDRDGTIYDLVPVARKAWHAGYSLFDECEDVNEFSIGVELANSNRGEKYSDAQLGAAAALVAQYLKDWPAITVDRITTHAHIRGSWIAAHPADAKAKGVEVKVDPASPFDLDQFKALVTDELGG